MSATCSKTQLLATNSYDCMLSICRLALNLLLMLWASCSHFVLSLYWHQAHDLLRALNVDCCRQRRGVEQGTARALAVRSKSFPEHVCDTGSLTQGLSILEIR